jgi:uncharacterized protein YlxW (UPF0749 family)
MKNNEANIFLFAACIIIGVLISMNISISGKSSYTYLSSEQYQDAYAYKTRLQNEISALRNQYYGYEEKLNKYQQNDQDGEAVNNEISSELAENNMILGKVAVEGEGVVIALSDADSSLFTNTFEDQFRLVHNTDIIQVLNDLKNGGAEAISINELRIVGNSEVYCSGPFLQINDVKIAAPFTIKAIGNSQVIYDYMMSDENYLKSLMLRKLNVNISRSGTLQIPAVNISEATDFIKEQEK